MIGWKAISLSLALLSSGTGLIAARYWLKASGIEVIPLWLRLGQIEPLIRDQTQDQSINALHEAYTASSGLNATAAKWTAASVALGGLSALAGALA